MHEFKMAITKYTGEVKYFTIVAENKADAVVKGKEYAYRNTHWTGGNYYIEGIQCIKKLQPKRKDNTNERQIKHCQPR